MASPNRPATNGVGVSPSATASIPPPNMIGTDTVAAMLTSPATIEPMKCHFCTSTTGRRRRSQPSERSGSTDAAGARSAPGQRRSGTWRSLCDPTARFRPCTNGLRVLIDTAIRLLAALALVVANAGFVAAEFALVAVDRARIDERAGQGQARAAAVQRLLSRLSYHLSGRSSASRSRHCSSVCWPNPR